MTGPRSHRNRAGAAVLAAAVLAGPGVHPAGGGPVPFSLAVQVDYGEPDGPTRLAEELRRRIVDGLHADGVVVEIVDPEAADVVLRIVLDEYLEETRYPMGMYERLERDDPLTRRQYTAAFEVLVRARLVVRESGEAVRSFRFKEISARAPRWDGEDAAAAVREEAVADIVRAVRKKTFKSRAKIENKIRDALAAAR